MEFRLTYRGPLKATANATTKQELRRHFHPQLRQLWENILEKRGSGTWQPLKFPTTHGKVGLLEKLGEFTFAPMVSQAAGWNAIAELDILFLRPTPAGTLIKHGGDLDNRLKVLIDGLRRPDNLSEIPAGDKPREGENPFHCLLQNDALVTSLAVTTDQLLEPTAPDYVDLVIRVRIKSTQRSMFNDPIW